MGVRVAVVASVLGWVWVFDFDLSFDDENQPGWRGKKERMDGKPWTCRSAVQA